MKFIVHIVGSIRTATFRYVFEFDWLIVPTIEKSPLPAKEVKKIAIRFVDLILIHAKRSKKRLDVNKKT